MTDKYTRRGYTQNRVVKRLALMSGGFTLIEILVVVLIIGILGAIALPQYQRAVLKSRFAALMPIAKSMADSNEAFYLEHGEYADNAEDLPVQGRRNYSDGTELEFGTLTGYSYVLATRDNNFPNNYIVYQKHSENYPGEIHCEANANDTKAQEVCKSFGPTQELGETLTSGYLTYVLFGTGNGEAPTGDEGGNEPSEPETPTCPDNSVCDDDGNVTGCSTGYKLSGDACVEIPPCQGKSCDDNGNITECASGLTLNNGECVTCDIPNATSCSTTSYAPTACSDGYIVNGTACEPDPTVAQLQALASSLCPANQTQFVCTIKNGAVSQCYAGNGGTINAQGECVHNGTKRGTYENVYNPDGTEKQDYSCYEVSSGHCYYGLVRDYAASTGKSRMCANNAAISKDATCANGYVNSGRDFTYDSHGKQTDENVCSAVNGQGVCTAYSSMSHYDNTYNANGTQTGSTTHKCTSISGTTCLTWDPPL